MKGGVLTMDDLKARCEVDRVRHCWNWKGARSGGQPRIWTLDYARVEKRCMSGPLAAWHIAYQAAPRDGCLVYRACMNGLCLNPAHLREARDKAEIGLHIRRLGSRVGNSVESRRANVKLALAAQGKTATPKEIVLAIKAADPKRTNVEVGRQLGIPHQTVSMIRTGKRHAGVVA